MNVEQPKSEPIEMGWLIERNRERGPEWAVFGAFGVEWTKDSNKACRFARREDAEQLAYGEDCDAVTEHMWASFETRDPAQVTIITSAQAERARRLMVAWDGGREYDEQEDDVWFGDVIALLRELVGDE